MIRPDCPHRSAHRPAHATLPPILAPLEPYGWEMSEISSVPSRVIERLEELASQYADLSTKLEDPAILSDHNAVRDLSIKRAAIEPVVAQYNRFRAIEAEAKDLRDAISAGDDAELIELAREELPNLVTQAAQVIERVKGHLVTADDRKIGSVMLEVRAGTGGDEAGLWAADLLAMYEKYAQSKRWKFETLDLSAAEGMGGIRHVVVNVKGEGVWAELTFEAGVHSVKRVPATESQGRIHTSTATVAVLPEPESVDVVIDWDKDVEENVTTSQGPGGQNVNKVATAVQIIHKPTGLMVKMQESKSQHQNREKARRLLMARLYEIELKRQNEERSAERRDQIGSGGRSEKIRVYRYQEGIVVDQRLEGQKFNKDKVLSGELGPLVEALVEQETARRLAAL
jgi:peptide chain release factor 1